MRRDQMQYDVRRARIYKNAYRPSSNISRFLGNLLSVIVHGQSQVGNTDNLHFRKGK